MSFGTLYTTSDNPRSIAIRAVAKANGLDLKLAEADTAKPVAEHKKANGLGKVPAFTGADGFHLSECIAIAVYVTSQNEKTTLLGKTKQDYASILRWMSFFNSEIVPPMGNWFQPLIGRVPYNKKSVDDAAQVVEKAIAAVEEHLIHNTYLVSERITLADLFCASLLFRGFQYFFGKDWRQAHPAVARWHQTVTSQPIYTDVAPKQELLEKPALTNVAPKKPEEPKAAPAAAAAAAGGDEAAPAPKPKHPIDQLPRSSFPLDEYKRYYSNNDTPQAMKYFWENVPFEEFSIWQMDFKYNDELTLTFMSNNQIGGFHARLEASRKYIFGCAGVYGVTKDNLIRGAYVIRGQEYEPVFDVAPDYESYSFKKLDPKSAEDRQVVEDIWGWEKPVVVDGKEYPMADGKVFK